MVAWGEGVDSVVDGAEEVEAVKAKQEVKGVEKAEVEEKAEAAVQELVGDSGEGNEEAAVERAD